jgi:4-hydroxy-tetrahydrodipicolinate synthase
MALQFTSSDLHGIIPPIVTPLQADGGIDCRAAPGLLAPMIEAGVRGVFVLGTTGEALSLGHQKRRQLVEVVAEQLEGQVPMVVGVTDTSLEESIELAGFAHAAGAAAVVAAPPFYVPIDQVALSRYYLMLAESIRLPLILYNMPSHTKMSIEAKTVLELSSHDNIIGMKDSGGDIAYFRRLVALLQGRDFPLLVGPEHLLWTALRAGGTGGVCGGANLCPGLHTALVRAHEQGQCELAAACDAMIQKLCQIVFRSRGGRSPVTEAIKSILESRDQCTRCVAPPMEALTEELSRSLVQDWNAWEPELSAFLTSLRAGRSIRAAV